MFSISGPGLELHRQTAGRLGCTPFGQITLPGGLCPGVLAPDVPRWYWGLLISYGGRQWEDTAGDYRSYLSWFCHLQKSPRCTALPCSSLSLLDSCCQDFLCVNSISQKDAVAHRVGVSNHGVCVKNLHWHSFSDGQTRDLDRILGPGEERGQLLEASQ